MPERQGLRIGFDVGGTKIAICVLDAGNNGIIFKADHVLAHGRYAGEELPSARVMGGPQAHWAKLAFERYFISSRKRGMVAL